MMIITQQQARERWDTLPEVLREALFSERNADTVISVSKSEHLAPEKISSIATLVGDVLLGFVDRDDLARELRSELNLNPQIADTIAKELDRKIFTPIRSEIDQNYRPAEDGTGSHIDLRREISPAASRPEVKPIVSPGAPLVSKPAWPEQKPSEFTPSPPIPSVKSSESDEPAPFMIHHEGGGIAPMVDTKKSLGGLFRGVGRGNVGGDSSHVAAKVDLGTPSSMPRTKSSEPSHSRFIHQSSGLPRPPVPALRMKKSPFRRFIDWLFGRSDTQLVVKNEEKSKKYWSFVSMVCLLLIFVNLAPYLWKLLLWIFKPLLFLFAFV